MSQPVQIAVCTPYPYAENRVTALLAIINVKKIPIHVEVFEKIEDYLRALGTKTYALVLVDACFQNYLHTIEKQSGEATVLTIDVDTDDGLKAFAQQIREALQKLKS